MSMLVSRFMSRRLGTTSAIRQAFEKAEQLKSVYGAENVFDFSIGSPTAPCPGGVRFALAETEQNSAPDLHGYMDSAGYASVRETVAASLARRFGTPYTAADIIMTTGAAAAINTLMQTVLNPEDEVIAFLPYYPAYRVFVENWGANLVEVPFDPETLLPNVAARARADAAYEAGDREHAEQSLGAGVSGRNRCRHCGGAFACARGVRPCNPAAFRRTLPRAFV